MAFVEVGKEGEKASGAQSDNRGNEEKQCSEMANLMREREK